MCCSQHPPYTHTHTHTLTHTLAHTHIHTFTHTHIHTHTGTCAAGGLWQSSAQCGAAIHCESFADESTASVWLWFMDFVLTEYFCDFRTRHSSCFFNSSVHESTDSLLLML